MAPFEYAVNYTKGGEPLKVTYQNNTNMFVRVECYCYAHCEEDYPVAEVNYALIYSQDIQQGFH
ncbi:MAG: hypothetical protein HY664_07355 [Chloroflexi bacterium]|nr:hypothetical protein [Chloroflexota bacterium]